MGFINSLIIISLFILNSFTEDDQINETIINALKETGHMESGDGTKKDVKDKDEDDSSKKNAVKKYTETYIDEYGEERERTYRYGYEVKTDTAIDSSEFKDINFYNLEGKVAKPKQRELPKILLKLPEKKDEKAEVKLNHPSLKGENKGASAASKGGGSSAPQMPDLNNFPDLSNLLKQMEGAGGK